MTRLCTTCGSPLFRRPKERPDHFAKRQTCERACGNRRAPKPQPEHPLRAWARDYRITDDDAERLLDALAE